MIRKYLNFVRFEHTVFALPFALASMAVAARATHGWPGWRTFLLILAAMVCARTSAMGERFGRPRTVAQRVRA
jgi:4-hydroxybenzoate polyprenyltransferase